MKSMFCANHFGFNVGDFIKLDLAVCKGIYKITEIIPQLPHSNIIEVSFESVTRWEKIKFYFKKLRFLVK